MSLRLFVPFDLAAGAGLVLAREQSHYVATVMRARAGQAVALFNGRDGEWLAVLDDVGKGGVRLTVGAQTRPQAPEPDIWLLAAPLKKDNTDLVAEKAAELGASALWPVFTRRTNAARVNAERLRAHLMEAAEQCERLTVPELKPPAALDQVLAGWDSGRTLLFLDEGGSGAPLPEVAAGLSGKLALLVGPEGGFAPEERDLLLRLPFARAVSLGPRILRAETAAIAALAVVQALAGDWKWRPRQA
ncbi:16S rRNA (uracil(1498)-N(3))-methyltransferase [Magnetospirillum sp. UT-4]|uniref:16S rRNA (uracil(1498)-N(3))-methyltransferase n=1 Tax=Magnetospirillum sp. UT-4 TaxID=2681467 RepID=UPI0013819C99|nr:16S rRNA (uracil(1498)-N(3))-methyltransferase [Magnetospirillum sp. UT-4]CAA7624549.1 Ribosomal RNA small subunit methyltransferase E [Magnetospirillum sp. UT-4]